MSRLQTRIKPKRGIASFLHIVLNILLPVLVYVLVRTEFIPLAYTVVLLSKWRMFAVRPRHWFANIRANAVDIIAGLSFVTFVANAPSQSWQIVWVAGYALWLVFIKPRSSMFWVSVQAMIAQLLGLVAVYLAWGETSLFWLVVVTWGVCYLCARHFFSSFDEIYSSFLANAWGYFGAALTWILGHWLLYYSVIAMPALLLSVIGYGLAILYYLHQNDRLSTLVRRQVLLVMIAVILVVIIFSDWGDKTV